MIALAPSAGPCLEKTSSKNVVLRQPGHESQDWAFDHVAGDDTSQEEMFRGKHLDRRSIVLCLAALTMCCVICPMSTHSFTGLY